MNKKLMAILGTVAVGGVLLGTTAFAAISGTSGYDVYKEAFKNTHALHSVTPKTEVSVTDNGNLLVKVDAVAEIDKENNSMSSSFTVSSGDAKQTVDVYKQDDKTVMKSSQSDEYTVMEHNKGWKHKKQWKKDDPERVNEVENVIDALAGDIQNYITLEENGDGTKKVTLQMSGNQVSPVINAVASLMVKRIGTEGDKEYRGHQDFIDPDLIGSLQAKLPKLVDNIMVSRLDVNAKITEDNLIQEQTQSIVLTGNDANGKSHEVVINIKAYFSDFNNTEPDQVNLDGKKVKTVSNDKYRHGK